MELQVKKKHWIDWSAAENRIQFLVKQICEFEQRENFLFENIYGIPRGGLYLAVRLSYLLKKPLIVNQNEIAKSTLIVDDCTNTGRTLSNYKEFNTLVLVHRKNSSVEPTFYGFSTNEEVNYFWESEDEVN